jgi:hypothetical protein
MAEPSLAPAAPAWMFAALSLPDTVSAADLSIALLC